jgi:hypothetical protein
MILQRICKVYGGRLSIAQVCTSLQSSHSKADISVQRNSHAFLNCCLHDNLASSLTLQNCHWSGVLYLWLIKEALLIGAVFWCKTSKAYCKEIWAQKSVNTERTLYTYINSLFNLENILLMWSSINFATWFGLISCYQVVLSLLISRVTVERRSAPLYSGHFTIEGHTPLQAPIYSGNHINEFKLLVIKLLLEELTLVNIDSQSTHGATKISQLS